MATVFIPATLRPVTGGVAKVEASGTTLREVIHDLARLYPPLLDLLIEDGQIRSEILLAVGSDEAFGLETPVPEGAEVHILPALAGG